MSAAGKPKKTVRFEKDVPVAAEPPKRKRGRPKKSPPPTPYPYVASVAEVYPGIFENYVKHSPATLPDEPLLRVVEESPESRHEAVSRSLSFEEDILDLETTCLLAGFQRGHYLHSIDKDDMNNPYCHVYQSVPLQVALVQRVRYLFALISRLAIQFNCDDKLLEKMIFNEPITPDHKMVQPYLLKIFKIALQHLQQQWVVPEALPPSHPGHVVAFNDTPPTPQFDVGYDPNVYISQNWNCFANFH